jgi:hypothetical protein
MINIRVRAFHMDRLPRCEHGRVLCKTCGFDPFENTPSHDSNNPQHFGADGGGVELQGSIFTHGSDQ